MEQIESEPDVGIEGDVYVCTNESCGEVVEADSNESDYMDDAARDEANHRGGS